ncbi:putative endonuclease [Streptococcus saliviloxodontae]|uniref:Endonuclease n=3 Tax=Streptococcus saliviloxodontae TaxID=1349416 RepID=A0ABS2PMA3_9STRE|nr:putative endonuclease [Streptococcus saliviloxodontae]
MRFILVKMAEQTKMTPQKAYMYVVECADKTLYTGYTTDIERRIKTHNAGKGAKYTKTRRPVKLLYWEEHPSKSAAMSAESYFKQKTRKQKLDYIEKHTSVF